MKYKLSQIMDIIGGGTPKTTMSEYWNGKIPWLSVKDFNNDYRYVYQTEKNITELGLENSSTNLLQEGDVIISARGTVGEIATIPFPMAFNQSCYGLRARKNIITADFLYYVIKNNIFRLKKNTHGSVFDTITRETFDGIEVDIPDIEEQKIVTSILGNYDEKIELIRVINNNLQQQLHLLFVQIFDGISADVVLGDVVEITSGGTPSRKHLEYYKNAAICWVKSKELLSNYIHDTEEHINNMALSKSSAKLLPEHSVLIAMYGATVGAFGIISKPMACNQAVCALLGNEKYPYTYLFQMAQEQQQKLINMAVGSAQQNISQILIKQLPLHSDVAAISKFHTIAQPLHKQIEQLQAENRTLSEMRDTLLPRLMSGELDVSEIDL